MKVTLATLTARARERADMVNSSFITDTADSLWAWVNEGAQKLHDKLVEAYGNEYVEKNATLTLVGGTTDYALPSDFYKILLLEIFIGSRWLTLKQYTRQEQNAFSSATVSWRGLPRYRLTKNMTTRADLIRMEPDPGGNYTGRVWYAPQLQVYNNSDVITGVPYMAATTDYIDVPNGWERYIILYAAIRALKKEESDSTALERELAKEESDLDSIIQNRNADQPFSAVDMDVVDLDPRWY